MKLKAVAVTLSATMALSVAQADLGNRYGLPQIYHSEVSAAEAYLLTTGHRDRYKHHKRAPKPVIIDVRRVEEYVAGHPPKAISAPFPHVTGKADEPNDATDYIGYDLSGDPNICFVDGCDTDTNKDGTLLPSDYVAYIEARIPNKDTPIMTLCRTGSRSVQVGNLLTAAGYSNVRNIWEGYVGQWKYAYSSGEVVPEVKLDMNHDDEFTDADKDGWSGFAKLPTSTRLHPRRIFQPYSDLYYQ